MNKLVVFIVAITLGLLLCTPAFAQCENAGPDSEDAQELASRYSNALIQGDTNELLAVLDSKLREEKSRILNRAGYWQQLVQFYSGASFTLVDCGSVGGGEAYVTVEIRYPAGDSSRIKLWMNNSGGESLLIFREETLY